MFYSVSSDMRSQSSYSGQSFMGRLFYIAGMISAIVQGLPAHAAPIGENSGNSDAVTFGERFTLERSNPLARSGGLPQAIETILYQSSNYSALLDSSTMGNGLWGVYLGGNSTMQFHASGGLQIYSTKMTMNGSPSPRTSLIGSPGAFTLFKRPGAALATSGDVGVVMLGDAGTTATYPCFVRVNATSGAPLGTQISTFDGSGSFLDEEPRIIAMSAGGWCIGSGDSQATNLRLVTAPGSISGTASTSLPMSTVMSSGREIGLIQLSNGNVLVVAEDGGTLKGMVVSSTLTTNVNLNWFSLAGSKPTMKKLPDGRPILTYINGSGQLAVAIINSGTGGVDYTAILGNSVQGLATIATNNNGQIAVLWTDTGANYGRYLQVSGTGVYLSTDPFYVGQGDLPVSQWINNGLNLAVEFRDPNGKPRWKYLDYDNPMVVTGTIGAFNTTYVNQTTYWTVPTGFVVDPDAAQVISYDVVLSNGNNLTSVGASFDGQNLIFTPPPALVNSTVDFNVVAKTVNFQGLIVERLAPIPFSINVGNKPLVFTDHTPLNVTVNPGNSVGIQLPGATDVEGDTPTYQLVNAPGYLSITPSGGYISGTVPSTSSLGSVTFQAAVRDPYTSLANADTVSVTIQVVSPAQQPQAPQVLNTLVNQLVPAGSQYRINLEKRSDGSYYFLPQDGSLTYNFTAVNPSPTIQLAYDSLTNDLVINSAKSDAGKVVQIVDKVTNSMGQTSQTFTVTLKDQSYFAPIGKPLNTQTILAGQKFTYILDPDTFKDTLGNLMAVLKDVQSLSNYGGLISKGTHSTKGWAWNELEQKLTFQCGASCASGVRFIFKASNQYGESETHLDLNMTGAHAVSQGDVALTILGSVGTIAAIAKAIWTYGVRKETRAKIEERASNFGKMAVRRSSNALHKMVKKDDVEMTQV